MISNKICDGRGRPGSRATAAAARQRVGPTQAGWLARGLGPRAELPKFKFA